MVLTRNVRHLHGLLRPQDRRKSRLQQLIECVPLETLVAELTALEPGGKRTLKACCCFHKEKSPSLHVVRPKEGKPFVHCFGCGAHATNALEVLGFVRDYDCNHWSPKRRIQFLSNIAGIELPALPKKKRRYPRTRTRTRTRTKKK